MIKDKDQMSKECQKSNVKSLKFVIWVYFVIWVLSFGFSSNVLAEPLKLTLDDAVRLAMQANYEVKIAKERLAKLDATIGEARSLALPHVTGTANYLRNIKRQEIFIAEQKFQLGYKNQYIAGANLTQPIYSAGKVLKALKAAKEETMSAEAILKDTREEIKLQVKKTFYQVLLADRIIGIKRKTLSQLTDQLNAIQKRYDQGIESDYTLMRQEVQVNNVLPELAIEEQKRVVLINALKDLMAISYNTDVELEGELKFSKTEIASENELVLQALSHRKDIEAKGHHIEALKRNVGIERGGYLPSLNFTSAIQWQGNSDKFKVGYTDQFYTVNVGLGFSLPIFDGLRTHYRVKQAQSDLKIASTEEIELRANVASEVKNVKSAFEHAVTLESSQKKSLDLAQKAVDIASLRFQQGLTSQLELNDTILQRDLAEQYYAQAVYACLDAEATLTRTVGGEL